MKIKTTNLKVKGDWQEVLDDCRFTVSKPPLNKEPSEKFKKSILIAEHSPIRDLLFKWDWLGIPTWVQNHWVRHKWEKYIGTQRTDRTNINRDEKLQSAPCNFRGEANTQHLIDTSRKRLCYQASKETRECAESLKTELRNVEKEVSDVLVPNCVYRGGCPEMGGCQIYKEILPNNMEDLLDIQKRYDYYNEWFYNNQKKVE